MGEQGLPLSIGIIILGAILGASLVMAAVVGAVLFAAFA